MTGTRVKRCRKCVTTSEILFHIKLQINKLTTPSLYVKMISLNERIVWFTLLVMTRPIGMTHLLRTVQSAARISPFQ